MKSQVGNKRTYFLISGIDLPPLRLMNESIQLPDRLVNLFALSLQLRNRCFEQEVSVWLLLGPGLVRRQAQVGQLENLVLLKPQNHAIAQEKWAEENAQV